MRKLLLLRRNSVLRAKQFFDKSLGFDSFTVILAMLTGVVAAVIAAALHTLVESFEKLSVLIETSGSAWWRSLLFILPFAGLFFSFMVQRWLGGRKYAKSLSPLILALNRRQTKIPFSEIFTHVLSSAVSVGCGGSAGLEAPSVLTGAAIGSNTGSIFGMNRRQRLLLIGCGGSAAIAAIFQSPIGGVLFAIEVLLPEFSVAALVPMLISSAVAMVISRAMFPHEQVLLAINTPWRTDAVPFYFICGLVCALVGVYVIRTAYWLGGLLKKSMPSRYRKLLVGGSALCILLAVFPLLRGQGYIFIAKLFAGDVEFIANSSSLLKGLPLPLQLTLLILAAIFLKVIASVLTVDSGGDGGIFAPTMFIGAFTGFAFARLINLSGIIALQEPNFVIVGICGVFSAVLRAPLTGIFLIADVTGSYILLVPLMIVSSVSWLVARKLEPNSIYNKALVEAGLLSEDRDHGMLQRLSVRLCVNTDYTILSPGKKLDQMRAALENAGSQEIFPVLDAEKNLVGVVHLDKLLPVMLNPELGKTLLIFDLMERPRGELTEESDLADAMSNLERFKLNYLPVKRTDGRFAGFVSRTDIFKLYRSAIRESDNY